MSAVDGVDVAICVPFTDLGAMVDSARGSRVEVYAQNMHQEPEGAFTGEVSAPMLTELGVHGVVLGHSERREHFGETDRALALKVPAALARGLTPILCVGETEGERDNDDTDRKLRQQIKDDLAGVPSERLAEVVIAYEPIWAIGTGRVATAEQAQEAIAFIRALVGDRDEQAADAVRILYGGSVKPGERGRAAGPRRRRRCARRRRLAAGGLVRADRRRRGAMSDSLRLSEPAGAVRLPGRARRLGAGGARAGQRRLAGAHAGVRRAVGRPIRTRPSPRAVGRWGCRTGRWATPRSAT